MAPLRVADKMQAQWSLAGRPKKSFLAAVVGGYHPDFTNVSSDLASSRAIPDRWRPYLSVKTFIGPTCVRCVCERRPTLDCFRACTASVASASTKRLWRRIWSTDCAVPFVEPSARFWRAAPAVCWEMWRSAELRRRSTVECAESTEEMDVLRFGVQTARQLCAESTSWAT